MSTLKARITALAGSVLMTGRLPAQAPPPAPEPTPEPPPDAIWKARETASGFSARLRELAEMRDEMDAAVLRERTATSADLPGMIEAGQPLPDLSAITGARAAAELRCRAMKKLVDREAESAQVALHAIHKDSLAKLETARAIAVDFVTAALPVGMFAAKEAAAAVELSAPVREAGKALESLQTRQRPAFLKADELFGFRVGDYRVDPLPVKHTVNPPEIQPRAIAKQIDAELETHIAAVRLVLAMQTDATTATWGG